MHPELWWCLCSRKDKYMFTKIMGLFTVRVVLAVVGVGLIFQHFIAPVFQMIAAAIIYSVDETYGLDNIRDYFTIEQWVLVAVGMLVVVLPLVLLMVMVVHAYLSHKWEMARYYKLKQRILLLEQCPSYFDLKVPLWKERYIAFGMLGASVFVFADTIRSSLQNDLQTLRSLFKKPVLPQPEKQ